MFVDKPAGLSSHDVVSRVRRAARIKRVGHAGTLDPFATGLLVIAVGPYTRLLPYIAGEPKVYDATIVFGSATDTDDAMGAPTETAPLPDAASVRSGIAQLTGRMSQRPPAYSAKHVEGSRAYELARRGVDVALPSSSIVVHAWSDVVLDLDGSDAGAVSESSTAESSTVVDAAVRMVRARIACSGGTYIRALARDLGRAADSVAHCAALRRVSSGRADVASAYALDALAPASIADGAVGWADPQLLLGHHASASLSDEALRELGLGRTVSLANVEIARGMGAASRLESGHLGPTQTGDASVEIAATDESTPIVLLHGGAVVGIAEEVAGALQPRVMLQ